MRRMFTVLALLITLLISPLVLSGHGVAVDIFPKCGIGSASGTPGVCNDVNGQGGGPSSSNPVITVIKSAINIISIITGVAAIIGILISSIKMITSGGDSSAVASARSGLVFSLIGVAVIILAQALVIFVLNNIK